MRLFVKHWALLLVLWWLPATNHCLIAAAEGVGCEHEETAPVSSCDTGSCAEDSCDLVEGQGAGMLATGLRALPPTDLELADNFYGKICPVLIVVEMTAVPVAENKALIDAIGRTWAFERRTALPARAPSDVS